MHKSDPALVQACLRGEKPAWDALIERYSRLVYSIPRRYGLTPEDAEEVFQNVFVAVFRALDRLKDQTRLSSWLITTTHRECWRVGKRSERYSDLDDRIENLANPSEDQLVAWERQHLVQQGLERLGGECERLLRMIFLDRSDPGYGAIARRLGMKVGSIGPTRARCLQKLQNILEGLGLFVDSLE